MHATHSRLRSSNSLVQPARSAYKFFPNNLCALTDCVEIVYRIYKENVGLIIFQTSLTVIVSRDRSTGTKSIQCFN